MFTKDFTNRLACLQRIRLMFTKDFTNKLYLLFTSFVYKVFDDSAAEYKIYGLSICYKFYPPGLQHNTVDNKEKNVFNKEILYC